MTRKEFAASFSKYVNLDELVYDITLILLAVFLRGLVVPQGKTVVDILNPVSAIVIIMLIDFFATALLGSLYTRFLPMKEKYPVPFHIITVILFSTAGVLYIALNENLRGIGLLDPGNMYIPYIAGIFLMTSGYLLGSSGGSKDGCQSSAVMFSIPVYLALFILFFYFADQPGGILLALGVTLGGAGVYTLLLLGSLKISEKLFDQESKAAGVLRTILFGIALPVLIALTMGFWQEISVIGRIAAIQSGDILPNVLLSLVLYGIIPVRILMALAPPYRIINTGVGLASLAVYIITLRATIESLIGTVK